MFSLDQYRALHEGAGLLDRTDRGRISLRGADRKAYLQGLLTNDILALDTGDWCYAALLTAQGRMIADMRVFELGDMILLDLERAVAPVVQAHLDMFVIAEDVVVEDVTGRFAQLGLYGPAAPGVLAAATGGDPSSAPLFILPGGDLGRPGADLIVPHDGAAALASALQASGAVRIDPETAEVARIEAGIPKFLVDMDTTTIPLEAGIEARAISLTKGCYVGQEVIIRVLHRGGGRVAKKLVGLVIEAREPTQSTSDSSLQTPGSFDPQASGSGVQRDDHVLAGEREVGRITSAADSPRVGKRIALAYVHRDFVEPGTQLRVRAATGESAAVVVALPFV